MDDEEFTDWVEKNAESLAKADAEENETILENYQYYNNAIETHMIPDSRQLPHLEVPEKVLEQIYIYLQ